jgi:hypothetical protein
MPVKNRSKSNSKNQKRNSRSSSQKRQQRQQRQQKQRGGRVSMPLEYFGGNSGRYFAEGSPELADGSSAYGPFYSVSQGVPNANGQMFGPNVGPYPASSCTQTGGKKRRSQKGKKSIKKSIKKSSKKTKSHKRK